MSLAAYEDKIKRLVVNVSGGRASPHKLCMLLAVLDLARAGALPRNEILFAPPLLERYNRFFKAVRAGQNHPNPYFPFFHLSGRLRGGQASFWRLRALPGRESILAALHTARSSADIMSNVACATLDPDLFALLQDERAIDSLAETIAQHWLKRGLEDLLAIAQLSRLSSRYERALREPDVHVLAESLPPPYVRDRAFRSVVVEAYDYRCAATGMRVVLSSGEAMVEAAHIHPFNVAGDDDPRNGIALSPDMHWAMDMFLIAPGPDFKWHVSPVLDNRIPDYRVLLDIDGKPLIFPKETRFVPKQESLKWRHARLRSA
jgi:putative restriction endonuclease